ncbi:MAG: glycosyltransferase family 4 protein [Candidatus Methylomirabilales bacterium]
MRLLFVSGYADLVGGGQRSLLVLLQRLDRDAFSPAVACPAEGEVARRARSLGAEVVLLDTGDCIDGVSAVRHAPRVRRTVARLAPHLVHCDTLYTALSCGLALAGTRIPVIFHARTSERAVLLDRVVPAVCARVVCVSQAAARRFRPRWASRVRVVLNGVDVTQFRPGLDGRSLRGRLGIPAQAFVIGYCGQLLRQKGLDHLLGAFARLREKDGSLALFLAGSGPDEAALRQAAGPRAFFHAFADSLPDFYAALDVFVLPTLLEEGLSRALLEAMACGLPCVATALGGNPEALGDGTAGVLVPAGDGDALARLLGELRRDPGRRRGLGRAARARALECFDAAATTRKMEAVYREVLA